MKTLIPQVQDTINSHELMSSESKILVGVSGGADSIAMLHVLVKCQTTGNGWTVAGVAHLNHGIRNEAIKDAIFVEEMCRELNVPFYTDTVDVPTLSTTNGISLEMAARDARYKFFEKVALQCGANAVATAHTRDDQAETILLKLCRGAGSAGLDGVAYSIRINNLLVIRPMLDSYRSEIEAYLRENIIPWHEDSTNADTNIKRNRIRHDILPQLEEHLNPRIKEALARTTSILREDNLYMDQQSQLALNAAVTSIDDSSQTALKVESLSNIPSAIRRRVIQQWLIEMGTTSDKLRFDIIERIIKLTLSPKGTGTVSITKDQEVRREYDLLHFSKKAISQTPIPKTDLSVSGETMIDSHGLIVTTTLRTGFERNQTGPIGTIPAEAIIRWDDETPPAIYIRSWIPGDRISPIGLDGSCKLKDLFINAKLSQSERANVPVFVCNDEVVWIPGYRISRNRAVRDKDQQSLQINIAPLTSIP